MADQQASDAVDQVRAAIAAGQPLSRKMLEHALRECFGLSMRQAKKFCAEGIRGLVSEPDDDDELREFAADVLALARRIQDNGSARSEPSATNGAASTLMDSEPCDTCERDSGEVPGAASVSAPAPHVKTDAP